MLRARVYCIDLVWSTTQLFPEPCSSTKQGKRIQIAGVWSVVKPTDLNVWRAGSEVLKKSYTPRMDSMSSSEGHFLNKCLMQSIIPAVFHPGLTSRSNTSIMPQAYKVRLTCRPNLFTVPGNQMTLILNDSSILTLEVGHVSIWQDLQLKQMQHLTCCSAFPSMQHFSLRPD